MPLHYCSPLARLENCPQFRCDQLLIGALLIVLIPANAHMTRPAGTQITPAYQCHHSGVLGQATCSGMPERLVSTVLGKATCSGMPERLVSTVLGKATCSGMPERLVSTGCVHGCFAHVSATAPNCCIASQLFSDLSLDLRLLVTFTVGK